MLKIKLISKFNNNYDDLYVINQAMLFKKVYDCQYINFDKCNYNNIVKYGFKECTDKKSKIVDNIIITNCFIEDLAILKKNNKIVYYLYDNIDFNVIAYSDYIVVPNSYYLNKYKDMMSSRGISSRLFTINPVVFDRKIVKSDDDVYKFCGELLNDDNLSHKYVHFNKYDILPMFECIINDSIVLMDNNYLISDYNYIKSGDNHCSYELYKNQIIEINNNSISNFLDIINNKQIGYKISNKINKKYIIPKSTLVNGRNRFFPEIYDSSYKTMEFSNLEELLNFFEKNDFNIVYIFEDFLNEIEDETEIRKLIFKLGNRMNDINFCFDGESKLTQFLNVISTQEGIKRVGRST